MRYNLFFLLLLVIIKNNSFAQIVINEVSSVNYDAVIDEDFDRPDWIELYNTGTKTINLKDWRISDKDDYEKAWKFPDIEIAAKSHLMVYASGKNYYNSGKFNMEASGYGINEFTYIDSYRFNYIRLTGNFEMKVRLHLLTGIYVFGSAGIMVRENLIPSERFYGVFGQRDDRHLCEFLYRDTAFRYPQNRITPTEMRYPECVLSVSRRNDSLISSIYDIEGYCLEKEIKVWKFPDTIYAGLGLSSTKQNMIGRAAFSSLTLNGEPFGFENLVGLDLNLNIPGKSYFSNELHTDFSLSREGEPIVLWNEKGGISDKKDIPPMYCDMSYGRLTDGAENWSYFLPPTPGSENKNSKTEIIKQPVFSIKPGFYNSNQSVRILGYKIKNNVYFTTDGSEPTDSSELYHGQEIFINQTTVLKARVYMEGAIPSEIETATYFINETDANIPVISISTDNKYFFDDKIGLFTNPHSDEEYPVTFEYFTSDLKRDYKNRTGFKTHGHGGALTTQISLRFNAKSKYGENDLNYPFFGDDGLKIYDKIVIRNSGQDWYGAFMRDAFISVLGEYTGTVLGTKYNPVLVYVNSNFWGLYNLRERFDDKLLESKFQIPSTSISIIEPVYRLIQGSAKSYHELLEKLPKTDEDSVYTFLEKYIDINNLIDYSSITFWSNNYDWPGMNYKFWKSDKYDNKWRWILLDYDLTLNHDYTNIYTVDLFKKSMEKAEEDQYNYHVPFILLKSFKNEQFRNYFLNRNCDLLNSILKYEFLTPLYDSLVNNIKNAIPLQKLRWPESIPNYEKHNEMIRTYFVQRPFYYREQLKDYFGLSGISKIVLAADMPEACTFSVNSLKNININWEGYYFNDIPVEIVVHPRTGYIFRGWKIRDEEFIYSDTLNIVLTDSVNILAVFEENNEPVPPSVVINEIMYKSGADSDTDDWIELYNPGDSDLDMSGWWLSDDNKDHKFIFPDKSVLKKKDFLVLIESKSKFNKVHSVVTKTLGEFDFGFGGEDMVRIYDKSGKTCDSVKYTSATPWYPQTNGQGPSLELLDPAFDNSIAPSWRASIIKNGTPGTGNSITGITENILDSYLKIYPNPATANVNIEFEIESEGNTQISIVDIFGNKIKTLLKSDLYSGKYSTFWDGKNESGNKMSAGIYFLVIETEKGIIRDKIILEN